MKPKYDRIGKDYNTTRKADPFLLSRMLHHLEPIKEGSYLDIGCGTGNYTLEFDALGYQFTGIDPSQKMLDKARSRKSTVTWVQGSAEQLNVGAHTFDGVLASLTLHHWADLNIGLSNINKVLKSDGKLVVFTATPRQMLGYWLWHYFPKMLEDSAKLMPSMNVLKEVLAANKFEITETEPYFIQPDLQDLFLYSGKHDPGRYLDDTIRNGISSFTAVAHSEEVKKGLESLYADIESQKVREVIQSYENDGGDYLFLIARKNV